MTRAGRCLRAVTATLLILVPFGCARSDATTPAATPKTVTPSAEQATGAQQWWSPRPGVSWQWQLTGPLDTAVDASVYDVDLFATTAEQVAQLHARGRRVICYLNVGSYEPGRPDSPRYPSVLLGRPLDGWPDERWLDIQRLDLLEPLIAARMDLCRAKGFDAVEPDNVDGYRNDTGFPLTGADQELFNTRVAELAHQRGLGVGLKNDLDQAAALQPTFDFAVDEQCVEYDECSQLRPFVDAGKAVLHVEYQLPRSEFCPVTRPLGFSSMQKHLNLDVARWPC